MLATADSSLDRGLESLKRQVEGLMSARRTEIKFEELAAVEDLVNDYIARCEGAVKAVDAALNTEEDFQGLILSAPGGGEVGVGGWGGGAGGAAGGEGGEGADGAPSSPRAGFGSGGLNTVFELGGEEEGTGGVGSPAPTPPVTRAGVSSAGGTGSGSAGEPAVVRSASFRAERLGGGSGADAAAAAADASGPTATTTTTSAFATINGTPSVTPAPPAVVTGPASPAVAPHPPPPLAVAPSPGGYSRSRPLQRRHSRSTSITETLASEEGGAYADPASLQAALDAIRMEELLEWFTAETENNLSDARLLLARLKNERKRIALVLANNRNKLLTINTALQIIGLSIGLCTMMSGWFGMNLDNGACSPEGCHEGASGGRPAFLQVVIITTSLAFLTGVILIMYTRSVLA